MIPRSTQFSTGTDERWLSLVRNGRSPVQNILVPTKFSAASTRAVEQAVALARLVGARLTLLHIIDIYGHPAWSHHAGSGEAFWWSMLNSKHMRLAHHETPHPPLNT